MERIIEERIRRRREAIEEARAVAKCLSIKFDRIAVILYGSYARGDFNEWSDIDLLAIVDRDLPPNPLKRLNMVEECLEISSRTELVILTMNELRRLLMKRNPLAVEAIEKGIEVLNTLGMSVKASLMQYLGERD